MAATQAVPPLSPRFPQEVFEHIIDHLDGDSSALKTCSRVCRSWVPRSRLHHFREIYCDYFQESRAQLIGDGSVRGCTLYELLSSPLCTFYHAIRRISVHLQGTEPVSSNSERWIIDIFSLIATIPTIKALGLIYLEWSSMPKPACSSILAGFSSISHLQLYHFTWESTSDLYSVLVSLPLLEHLHWEECEVHRVMEVEISVSTKLLRLHTLEIFFDHFDESYSALGWLLLHKVKHLELIWNNKESDPYDNLQYRIDQLLQLCGKTVETVNFTCLDLYDTSFCSAAPALRLDLSTLQGLRSFTHVGQYAVDFPYFISTAKFSSITEINCVIDLLLPYEGEFNPDSWKWAMIDHALTTADIQSLKSFNIVFRVFDECAEALREGLEAIRQAMVWAENRGLLRCSVELK